MTARTAEQQSEGVATLTVHVPLTIRRRGGRRRVIAPAAAKASQSVKRADNDPLLTALARAYRWQRRFEGGAYSSISELAAAEGVDRSYAGKVMRLMLLAPDLIDAILDGTEPDIMAVDRLLAPFPVDWRRQRAGFGVGSKTSGCS